MPNLFAVDPEEEAAEQEAARARTREETQILEELALLDTPTWEHVTAVLTERQNRYFEDLFTAPPEKIQEVRARISEIRYLLGQKNELEARLASIRGVEET